MRKISERLEGVWVWAFRDFGGISKERQRVLQYFRRCRLNSDRFECVSWVVVCFRKLTRVSGELLDRTQGVSDSYKRVSTDVQRGSLECHRELDFKGFQDVSMRFSSFRDFQKAS